MKLLLITLFASLAGGAQILESPSGKLQARFFLEDGTPFYSLSLDGKPVLEKSRLGIFAKDNNSFSAGLRLVGTESRTVDQTWSPVLGEESQIRNWYNELKLNFIHDLTGSKMSIVFRLFNEGLAFRYELPIQPKSNYLVLAGEATEFRLTGDYNAFWIPGDFDSNEYVYNETPLSGIDVSRLDMNNGIGFKGPLADTRVQSPLQMKTAQGMYINIFEAAVDNYPVMHLQLDPGRYAFTAAFAPNAIGDIAYVQAPFNTPWRTVMATMDAREILASRMILNLNEPSRLTDVSWIRPMKYVGIWWEMHVGKSTWDYAGLQNAQNNGSPLSSGKHGATTQNAKRYIDFAAGHGFDAVLIEGWNTGWEDWFGNWKEEVFDFTTPYPDFDLEQVTGYAKEKNVKLIMHHETSGSVANYERRLDRAFGFMKKYGYDAVKTGYVGRIIPRGEYHDGQTMVNHYHHVVKRAADYRIMVNSHESSRPTGMHRTWPNWISSEAARGNEFNAWSNGNPPMHETILPFTRLLGGPMDYTPGIFEIRMSTYDPSKKEQVHTTLAKQLALYVTLYSPLQMAADLPENYEKHLDAFQFIKDVPADWSQSVVLEAEPGDYVTIARQDKKSENWFLGAITDENPRTTTLKLDFLSPGKKYKAVIYADGKGAHWKDNPKLYVIRTVNVTSKSKLKLELAAGGGTAISFFTHE